MGQDMFLLLLIAMGSRELNYYYYYYLIFVIQFSLGRCQLIQRLQGAAFGISEYNGSLL